MRILIKILLAGASLIGFVGSRSDFRNYIPYPDKDSKWITADTWLDTGYYALDYLQTYKATTDNILFDNQPIVTQYLTFICHKLAPGEHFRLKDLTREHCATVGTCLLQAGQYSVTPTLCEKEELYDIDLQKCRPSEEVQNCDKPFGERSSVLKALNRVETPVDLTENCNEENCKSPECYCSKHGQGIPGNLDSHSVPQMILISFTGSVGLIEAENFASIFSDLKNPNGCNAKGTYFVSNKYSSYATVQQLYNYGHEIASFSVTSEDNSNYWVTPDNDTYKDEFVTSREILHNFANVPREDIKGMRVPYLYLGGEKQFQMMEANGFEYDSTVLVAFDRFESNPIWPYNLKFGMPHACHGLHDENCPKFSTPYDLWVVPLNELDPSEVFHSQKSHFDQQHRVIGCGTLSLCRFKSPKHFRNVLVRSILRHHAQNKAPITWSFNAGFFRRYPIYLDTFKAFLKEISESYSNVYFVTYKQAIDWMKNPTHVDQLNKPTDVDELKNFELWKGDKCKANLRSLKATCRRTPKACEYQKLGKGKPEIVTMFTCNQCPNFYPWIGSPKGINTTEFSNTRRY